MSAVNVGNPLAINLTCLNTREFTLEKGLLNVMNVGNLLPLVLPSVTIREFTQEKNLTSAVTVGNPLPMDQYSSDTVEFTQEKGLMSATNVLPLTLDAFELWCWRRLLRVPCTIRKSNQSVLMETSPEYSIGRTDAKAETSIFWSPDAKN